jgi:hypothetical protein
MYLRRITPDDANLNDRSTSVNLLPPLNHLLNKPPHAGTIPQGMTPIFSFLFSSQSNPAVIED